MQDSERMELEERAQSCVSCLSESRMSVWFSPVLLYLDEIGDYSLSSHTSNKSELSAFSFYNMSKRGTSSPLIASILSKPDLSNLKSNCQLLKAFYLKGRANLPAYFISNIWHVQWAIPQTYNEGSIFIQVREFFFYKPCF